MKSAAENLEQAYRGEGALYEALLAERTRELAEPAQAGDPLVRDDVPILRLRGRRGARWALPLSGVVRVEDVPAYVKMPGRELPVLGLCLMAGRRCLLADLENLMSGGTGWLSGQWGHAVLLRGHPVALAVERAESLDWVASAPASVPAALSDGAVWLDEKWLVARLLQEAP